MNEAPETPAADMNPDANLTVVVKRELEALVTRLAEEHQTWGLGVMALGIQLIAVEMRAIDRKGCGQYFRAIADLMDPPEAKLRTRGRREFLTAAEERRRGAVQILFDKVKAHLAMFGEKGL